MPPLRSAWKEISSALHNPMIAQLFLPKHPQNSTGDCAITGDLAVRQAHHVSVIELIRSHPIALGRGSILFTGNYAVKCGKNQSSSE
ncbi:MAG: hypothetical protein ACLQSR_13380 [Limisphaerales bacterium]